MRYLLAILCALVFASVAYADDPWGRVSEAAPANAGEKCYDVYTSQRCWYVFTAQTNSEWIVMHGKKNDFCLNPNIAADTLNANSNVKIREAITDRDNNGSGIVLNITLDGQWPNRCARNLPPGSYQVQPQADPGAVVAAVVAHAHE